MRFKILMTVNAALASCFGVACLLSPAAMLSSYGVSLKPIGLVVYQLMGAALVGIGTLSWLARDTEAPRRRRAIALVPSARDLAQDGKDSRLQTPGSRQGHGSRGGFVRAYLRERWPG